MKVCDKCRCRSVCGMRELYDTHLNNAMAAYKPEDEGDASGIFEIAIRCHNYIPERKAVNTDERNAHRN